MPCTMPVQRATARLESIKRYACLVMKRESPLGCVVIEGVAQAHAVRFLGEPEGGPNDRDVEREAFRTTRSSLDSGRGT